MARHALHILAHLILLLWASAAHGADTPRSVEPTDYPYCCVAEVQCGDAGGSATLVGVQGNRGLAITAAHVVEGGSRVSLRFPNGYKCKGSVLGRNPSLDLAAIELPAVKGLRTVYRVRPAKSSDGVLLAVGYPYYERGEGRPHYTTGPYLGYANSDVEFRARPSLHSGFSGGGLFAPDGSYLGSTNGYGDSYSYAASGQAMVNFVGRWLKVERE